LTTDATAPATPPAGALRAVLANPGLRRIEIAWTLGIAGDAAFTVALLVAAFAIGGPVAVGILTIVRMAPSVIGAPLAGLLAGRRQPTELLFLAHGLRALGAAAATLVLVSNGPVLIGLLAATVAASAGAFVRPLQVAAMPGYAVSPDELVAANGATSTGEGLGSFLGPLVGAVLVAGGGAVAAAAVATALFFAAAAALARLEPSADERARREVERSDRAASDSISIAAVGRELTMGLRVIARRRGAAVVLLGFAGQVFVRGLLTTLIVVVAIRLLGLGEPGVGTLGAAYGLGTLAGAILSVRLVAGRRLAPTFAVSLSLWGLPLAVIAAVPEPAVAIAALAISGIANATLDVAGFTLLQRCVSGAERVAIFGLLEATVSLGVGIGGATAPLLIDALGDRGALAVAGAILPVLAVGSWSRLHAVDRDIVLPERELRLLRGIPLFARLPLAAMERLAQAMRLVQVTGGETLVREGDPGDAYFVIATGRFEVRHGSRLVSVAGVGDGIGEIALLRAVPRTASVVAVESGSVYVLDSAAFMAAVAGPTGAAAAAVLVDERLARSAAG
jgi:MFS family permease